ncbi:hypothetical protein PVAP13_2KG257758 [Panicum virgatum]|uniref:Uncharacterized protein n=1 Tax=Panicum virgatum TaxID=38727 RepID=A0A8T0WBT2_PANVG|nr:hypothetical protein PVAP13_2KG257758 [Panicum virgatum]
MEQKMALVKDDDYQPMDNELPVVVTHQPGAIPCGDDDDEVIPIKIVRPRRVRRKLPGVPQTDGAKRISKGIHTITGVRNFLSWKIIIGRKALNYHGKL